MSKIEESPQLVRDLFRYNQLCQQGTMYHNSYGDNSDKRISGDENCIYFAISILADFIECKVVQCSLR